MTLFAIKVSKDLVVRRSEPGSDGHRNAFRAWHGKHNVVVGNAGVLQGIAGHANFQIDTQSRAEALPLMVLPVINTWSQVFPVTTAGAVSSGENAIPVFWMFDNTRLLMVMLEKLSP